jgi:uncharacterized membrane protein YccF (DUF307 family)
MKPHAVDLLFVARNDERRRLGRCQRPATYKLASGRKVVTRNKRTRVNSFLSVGPYLSAARMPSKAEIGSAAMNAALNFLWFLLGGWLTGLLWFVFGAIMAITVIGLPWARSCFVLGRFCLFPFGYDVISRRELTGESDLGTGALGTIGNILWFLTFGWIQGMSHLVSAILLAVTIIGIPFSIQHLKLAGASLAPVGKTVRPKELVALAKQENAMTLLQRLRQHQA